MSTSNPKIIKRGSVIYVVYDEKVLVGHGMNQWISYNQYENFNRQGITQFRNAILKSGENEYATPTDQMTLAYTCGIKGTGTVISKEIKELL